MKNNKSLTILFISLAIVLAVVIFYALYQGGTFNFSDTDTADSPNPNIVVEDAIKEKKEVVREVAATQTYDEIREENPDIASSPNLSDTELKNELNSVVDTGETENYQVSVTESAIDPAIVVIEQGDYVTWNNDASFDIDLIGSNDWSLPDIASGQRLTQEFSFLGEYNYQIFRAGTEELVAEGVVKVESPR